MYKNPSTLFNIQISRKKTKVETIKRFWKKKKVIEREKETESTMSSNDGEESSSSSSHEEEGPKTAAMRVLVGDELGVLRCKHSWIKQTIKQYSTCCSDRCCLFLCSHCLRSNKKV